MSTTRDGPAVIDVKPNTGKKNRDLCPSYGGLSRNIVIMFGTKKTRMLWLHDGEKILQIYLFVPK